jgi:small subunit ribosomal protein S8
MTKDLISDMLTKLRNANLIKQNYTLIKYTNINFSILKILLKQGYIKDLQLLNTSKKKEIKVFLKYKGWWIKKSVFSKLERISKPGRRIFSDYRHFSLKCNYLKSLQGIAIISTSTGIMTNFKAKKLKKGGEIICYIQ